MRICLVSTSFPCYEGHVQSPFLLHMAKAFISKGLRVDVICPYVPGSKREDNIAGIHVHRFHYFWPRHLQTLTAKGGIPSNLKRSFFAKIQFFFVAIGMLIALYTFVRKNDIDLIHAQWSLPGFVAVLVKKRTKTPVVVTERGAALNLAIKNKLMRPILMYTLKQSDMVTANNHKQIAMIQQLGIHPEKTRVIINGVENKLFFPRNKEMSKKKVKKEHRYPLIVFVGWLIERKGVEYLLEAVNKVRKKFPQVQLLIIGQGVQEPLLKQRVKHLALENHVSFLGEKHQIEIATYMNAADLLALPSLSEGRANVLAEALSCSIPIVATDVGDAASLVVDGVNGFLCAPRDANDLAEKILKICSPAFQKTFKRRIQQIKREKLISWSACADQYQEVFRKVLAQQTGSGNLY